MKRFLEAIPIPLCGIMLAIVSLGNLLQAVFTNIFKMEGLGYICHITCFIITFILLVLILLKVIFCFKMVVEMLENPETMGIFSCYSLTLMIWAGYLPEYIGDLPAQIVWWVGVLVHYTNMVIFTYKYVVHFKLPTLLPPWYIVYVGFALSGFSAQNFAPHWFGIAAFYIGFVCFWIIFFMLIKRERISPIPRMDEPTLCINAAIGICLTTYDRNFANPSPLVIAFLYLVSLAIWIWIMFKLPKLLKLPFYPTDSAFSFPFVVSAIASMETNKFAMAHGFDISIWNTPIIVIQTIVAVLMTGFAIWRFTIFIIHCLKDKTSAMRMMSLNMMKKSRNMDMSEGMNIKAIGKAMKVKLS